MLLRVGKYIINAEQIVYAKLEGEELDAVLTIYMVNIHAGNARTTTSINLYGDQAAAMWKVLNNEARDVLKKDSTGQVEFRA